MQGFQDTLDQDNKLNTPSKLLSFSGEKLQRCDDLDFVSTLQLKAYR